jgi:hypothetical protein
LFAKRFSQPQASIKLDRKSCGDSSPVLQISSEQTIGRADNPASLFATTVASGRSRVFRKWIQGIGPVVSEKENVVVQDGRFGPVEQAILSRYPARRRPDLSSVSYNVGSTFRPAAQGLGSV